MLRYWFLRRRIVVFFIITSRFGRPGFLGNGWLFWLPKLFECCRLFFFPLLSHRSFVGCNDNWLFNVVRGILLLLFIVFVLSTNIFVLLDERWFVLSREATTNGVSTITFWGRISSFNKV